MIIKDKNFWGDQRRGHKYSHTCKDIRLVKNGSAKNKVISKYNNKHSAASCVYAEASKSMSISNLTIDRDPNSKFATICFLLQNLNEVNIRNVQISTPGNPKNIYGDGAFTINDCANLTMTDVRIVESYSLSNKYGSSIKMNNVWNSLLIRLYGRGTWGIFGNNDINDAYLDKCDFNRFDVYCYGKNVTFKICTFKNYYNQYSCVYGTVLYDGCYFEDFVLFLNGGSYNAHVPVKVLLENSTWKSSNMKNYVADDWGMDFEASSRPELKKKVLPTVKVSNLKIIGSPNQS